MKKIAMLIIAMTMTLAAQAQNYYKSSTPFHSDKYYIGASLTGFDLNYSGKEEVKIGAQAQLGYMFFDNVLGYAEVVYNNGGDGPHTTTLGVGGRYYIEQNGLFLGAKLAYQHAYNSYDDLLPGVEIGYSYFLSRTVTIEPAIYYNQSFKHHSDYSNLGFRIGFGIYLND